MECRLYRKAHYFSLHVNDPTLSPVLDRVPCSSPAVCVSSVAEHAEAWKERYPPRPHYLRQRPALDRRSAAYTVVGVCLNEHVNSAIRQEIVEVSHTANEIADHGGISPYDSHSTKTCIRISC